MSWTLERLRKEIENLQGDDVEKELARALMVLVYEDIDKGCEMLDKIKKK